MPEGQYVGTKTAYLYTSDSGEVFLLNRDTTLGGLPGTGLTPATSANVGTATPMPKRFTPRYVLWKGTLSGRTVQKRIICDSDGTLYQAGISQALTIDGVVGETTGKVGEKATFTRVPTAGG